MGNRPTQRPSTAPVTNSANSSFATTPASPTNADSSNRNSSNNGLNTGNFNQLPGGLSRPNPFGQTASDSIATPPPQRDSTYASSSQGNSNTIQRYEYDPKLTPAEADRLPPNGWSFNLAGNPVDREGYLLNAYGERIDANGRPISGSTYANDSNRPNPNLANSTNTNGSSPSGTPTNGQPTNGGPDYRGNTTYASQQGSHSGANYPNYAASNNGNPNTGFPNTASQTPGSLYNNAQQPAAPMPNSAQPPSQFPYPQNYASTQVPYAPTNANPTAPNINPATGFPYQYINYPANNAGQSAGNLASNNAPTGGTQSGSNNAGPPPGRGAGSLDDKDALAGGALSQDPRADREKVATQTLFNALLLVSFVANLYLMYWLNVLRLKYQEMVAAKRAAASSNSAAVA
jgi:hypothetical protein